MDPASAHKPHLTEPNTLTRALAALIVRPDVPLQAIGIAGEVITLEAALSDYPPPPTLEKWGALAESHELVLKRAMSAVKSYEETLDGEALIRDLGEIRLGLSQLGQTRSPGSAF